LFEWVFCFPAPRFVPQALPFEASMPRADAWHVWPPPGWTTGFMGVGVGAGGFGDGRGAPALPPLSDVAG
jgi:hypothetical protein